MEALQHREHEVSWREFVMERVSRFCASYFDDGQAQIHGVREGGFYSTWRAQAQSDQGPQLFMALGGYRDDGRRPPEDRRRDDRPRLLRSSA